MNNHYSYLPFYQSLIGNVNKNCGPGKIEPLLSRHVTSSSVTVPTDPTCSLHGSSPLEAAHLVPLFLQSLDCAGNNTGNCTVHGVHSTPD